MRKIIIALTVAGAAVALAACGTAATPAVSTPAAAAAPVTVTVAAPSSEAPAPAPVPAPAPAPIQTPVAAPSSAPVAAPAPVKVPMPDVVGMNLQAAQDKIQEAGVFYSRSEDATGAGRMQVVDSNWVVVSQTPAPGELIGEGDAVLSAKKIGE